jgi:DNA gyrase subunit A
VTVTHKGYIKRMALDTYKTQKRGGKGVKGASSADDDFFTDIFTANTHSTLFFFTSKGTVFAKKVYTIPEGSRTSKGRNMANLIQVPPGEKIKEILCIPHGDNLDNKFLLFATERGVVKKSELSLYKNVKQSGLGGINVDDGDKIVNVRLSDGTFDVLLCSTSGKIIRFNEEDVRPMGRVSRGVRGINITDDERIIGMEIITDSVEVLTVTENGYGKRTSAIEYRKTARGGKGILAMKLTEKNGEICAIKPVKEDQDLMIITDQGQVIRTMMSGISMLGRVAQGVRIIRLKDGEKVVAVEGMVEEDDEGIE